MSEHPTTPIDEADLTRFLGRQTHLDVTSFPLTDYSRIQLLPPTPGITVLDALDDDHLRQAGSLVLSIHHESVFALGSGGLSRAVGMHLGGPRQDPHTAPDTNPATPGPVLVVSGSHSAQTRRQIESARGSGWPVRDLHNDDWSSPEDLREWTLEHLGNGGRAIVHSQGLDGDVSNLLPRLADVLSSLVQMAADHTPHLSVIICGGDTSSRMLRRMTGETLEIDWLPCDNVVVSRLRGPDWPDGLPVLLKGGQVGPTDLFELVRRGRS